jgi:hypothetical protein
VSERRSGKDFNSKTFSSNLLQDLETLLAYAWIDIGRRRVEHGEVRLAAFPPALAAARLDRLLDRRRTVYSGAT